MRQGALLTWRQWPIIPYFDIIIGILLGIKKECLAYFAVQIVGEEEVAGGDIK